MCLGMGQWRLVPLRKLGVETSGLTGVTGQLQ